jgi:transposase
MSKNRLKVNVDSEIIKSQLRKDDRFSQGIRLYAVYQVSTGKLPGDIASLYDTSIKSICTWVHRYNSGGIDALKDLPRSGRKPRLDAGQKSDLENVIQTAPQQYCYNTSTWTGALLADFIRNKYGIEYKKAHIYNILRSLNFSFQKSRGYFPEAAERTEKVEAIKKNF